MVGSNPPLTLGLYAAFYLTSRPESEPRLVAAHEAYVTRYGQHLCMFLEDDTGKPRPFGKAERDYPRRRLAKSGTSSVFWHATGNTDPKFASSWTVTGEVERPDVEHGPDTLSGMWFSLHPDTAPAEFLEHAFTTVSLLDPYHGQAGYGVIEPPDIVATQMAWPGIAAVAHRFAGVEVNGFSTTSVWAMDGIKSVNWLTILSEELVERVGGRKSLRRKLSTDIVFHELPKTLVLQAGPAPKMGDVNGVDELQLYREVAQTLKPIFSKTVNSALLYPDLGEWRDRLFKGAKWPP